MFRRAIPLLLALSAFGATAAGAATTFVDLDRFAPSAGDRAVAGIRIDGRIDGGFGQENTSTRGTVDIARGFEGGISLRAHGFVEVDVYSGAAGTGDLLASATLLGGRQFRDEVRCNFVDGITETVEMCLASAPFVRTVERTATLGFEGTAASFRYRAFQDFGPGQNFGFIEGFSYSAAALANVAAVPIPSGAWLLPLAFGALTGFRRGRAA